MKNIQDTKFYKLSEVVAMGILPYNSESTLRRLIKTGAIRAVRNPSQRSYYYITNHEIARLQGLIRENQDISGALETT